LTEELETLQNVRLVLTLGRVALDAYLTHIPDAPRIAFKHGALYKMDGERPLLMTSYHPSRLNTQTRKLTWEAWSKVFAEARNLLNRS